MLKILIATDFSAGARAAGRRAARLAAASGGEIVALHVFDPQVFEHTTDEIVAEERNSAQLLLDELCGELNRGGTRATGMLVDRERHPDEIIVDVAESEAAGLVVLGSTGRTGMERLFVGSIAERVVQSCGVPVLIARGEADGDFTRILCATDFSEHADRALTTAFELAAPGATIDVLYAIEPSIYATPDPRVVPGPSQAASIEADVRRRGAELIARPWPDRAKLTFAHEVGRARSVILDRLEGDRYDLVTLGSHGRRGLRRFFLGSVAESVVRHAPCSVLVAR